MSNNRLTGLANAIPTELFDAVNFGTMVNYVSAHGGGGSSDQIKNSANTTSIKATDYDGLEYKVLGKINTQDIASNVLVQTFDATLDGIKNVFDKNISLVAPDDTAIIEKTSSQVTTTLPVKCTASLLDPFSSTNQLVTGTQVNTYIQA